MYTSNEISTEMIPLINYLGALFKLLGLLILIPSIIILISQWKIYKKAGKGGWKCLIPIYNIIVLLQIVELPMWYIALFFVPFANIYAMFKIYIELAHKFGKSTGFGVLTVFFNIICFPILAFSKNCVYQGNNNNQNNVQKMNVVNNSQTVNNNYDNQLNNNLQPITFNQNINTEDSPINSLGFEPTAPLNNQFVNNMENQPEQNIIPNVQNQQVEFSQPIQTQNTVNMSQMNMVQPEQTNNQMQGINVIPNLINAESTINNINTNSLLQQQSNPQPQLNVIPGIQTQPVEQPQPIQTQNIVNVPEANINLTQSVQPTNFVNNNQTMTFNPQPQNNAQVQGINVIPTLGPTPTIQNTNNNQNV